jgi:hypothetical protein
VLDADLIAATEGLAVVVSGVSGDVGVTELVTVVYVGSTVVLEVFAGTFDAVVEALLLNFFELGRGVLPWLGATLVAGRRRSLGDQNSGAGKGEGGCEECEGCSFQGHAFSFGVWWLRFTSGWMQLMARSGPGLGSL